MCSVPGESDFLQGQGAAVVRERKPGECRKAVVWLHQLLSAFLHLASPEGDMRGVVGRYPCKVIRVQTVEFAMQMTWVAGSSESKFTGMFCIVTKSRRGGGGVFTLGQA